MMLSLKRLLTLIIISITALTLTSHQPVYSYKEEDGEKTRGNALYSMIADEYLPVFGSLEEMFEREKNKEKDLNPYELTAAVFNMFEHENPDLHESDIVSKQAWKDLNFYAGTEHPDESLITIINRTRTIAGEVALARILTQPKSDIRTLRKRQAVLQEFLKNDILFKETDSLLKKIKKNEAEFLSFEYLRDLSRHPFIFDTDANKHTVNLESSQAFYLKPFIIKATDITLPITDIFLFIVLVSLPFKGAELQRKGHRFLPIFMYFLLTAAMSATTTIQWINTLKEFLYLKRKMKAVDSYLNNIDRLVKKALQNKTLSFLVRSKNKKIKPLASLIKKIDKVRTLFDKLSSRGVQADSLFGYYTTRAHTAVEAYAILVEIRHHFSQLIEMAGEIDAYLSTAKYYKECSSHERAPLTFVEYTQNFTPKVEMSDMWNPFIPQDCVITNNVEFGQEFESANAVVTGPNAGGKSTVLKGITLNILIGQIFGIAWARKMTLTPFAYIATHLNIVDETGHKSLFQAEVYRAQEVVNRIKQLGPGEFCFTVMDEVFNGTNPVEGEAAALSIGHYISMHPQSMCVIATHFPRLTLLPELTKNKFKNYKVYVNFLENGSFTYPYQFIPGTADQHIAIDILQAQGFDTSILALARDVIANPDKYPIPVQA